LRYDVKVTSRIQPRNLISKSVGGILEFLDGEDKGRQVPVLFMRTTIGRKVADILVRDINVSGLHASVEWRNDAFWVVDQGSSNGTYVGDKRIQEAPLQAGVEFRVGLTRLKLTIDPELAFKLRSAKPLQTSLREGGLSEILKREFEKDPEPAEATVSLKEGQTSGGSILEFRVLLGHLKGRKFTFRGPSILIGRRDVDFNLKDPDASRKHALIEVNETGQVVIRDLASRNGTFVNDRRVANCVLGKGDHIRVGRTTFAYAGTVNE
jgi:pSer/pThr/pTyr-binding forkhead associated (FHA) protein